MRVSVPLIRNQNFFNPQAEPPRKTNLSAAQSLSLIHRRKNVLSSVSKSADLSSSLAQMEAQVAHGSSR